jgi:hypothetical protein
MKIIRVAKFYSLEEGRQLLSYDSTMLGGKQTD